MKKILYILIAVFAIGCTVNGKPVDTGSYGQVTSGNVFTYGPAIVIVNPDFEYFRTSERLNLKAEDWVDSNAKKEYHIFAEPNLTKGVIIITLTIRNTLTHWRSNQDLMKNIEAIEKEKTKIDDKTYHCCIRAFSKFPEPMLSAIKERGKDVENFRCGLEKAACRVLSRFKLMCVHYIEELYDCSGISNHSHLIGDKQKKVIQEFAKRFDENITISHK